MNLVPSLVQSAAQDMAHREQQENSLHIFITGCTKIMDIRNGLLTPIHIYAPGKEKNVNLESARNNKGCGINHHSLCSVLYIDPLFISYVLLCLFRFTNGVRNTCRQSSPDNYNSDNHHNDCTSTHYCDTPLPDFTSTRAVFHFLTVNSVPIKIAPIATDHPQVNKNSLGYPSYSAVRF